MQVEAPDGCDDGLIGASIGGPTDGLVEGCVKAGRDCDGVCVKDRRVECKYSSEKAVEPRNSIYRYRT